MGERHTLFDVIGYYSNDLPGPRFTMADQKLLELAKFAERSERYEDMAAYMEQFTQDSNALSPEERNLLSVAFKNVVGARRSSWRVISSLEQKEEVGDDRKRWIEDYRGKVENELKDICNKVLVRHLELNIILKFIKVCCFYWTQLNWSSLHS